MKYTVHQAKTNLSRLLEEASSGKEVAIARGKKGNAIAKIVAVGSGLKKRVPGRLLGKVSASADAFAPLTERELQELGFE